MPRAPPQRKVEGESKPTKIPRPPNAWILYRTDRLHEWRASRSPNAAPVKQADISRVIASKWRIEPDPVKLEYEKRAAIAKAEHKKKYPDYKYNPISKEAKDKMRAEEREAKKKAREEAKAAKASNRSLSYTSRHTSSSPRASTSGVKLESFDIDERKPIVISEPINRGCGPSPPIDYDPECSSTSSGTPFLSSSSSASVRSSPFPSSASLPPPTPLDPSNVWSHSIMSPLSSSPSQPPPAYPSGLLHSPLPSRHSSYNLLTAQSSASTPSDSPPSYSEGDGWQSQVSTLGFQPFAPVPDFQGDWSGVSAYSPSHQPELSFSLPPLDSLLGGPSNLNLAAASVESVYDIMGNHSAQSPPGELDLGSMLQHFSDAADLHNAQNSQDQLGPMLDMPELHEAVEDNADAGGFVLSGVQPFSLEDFAAWVNSHPQTALDLADPNYYLNLGATVASEYQQVEHQSLSNPSLLPPQQHSPSHLPDSPAAAGVDDPSMFNLFNFALQQEIAMPVPVTPITMSAIGSVPSASVVSNPTAESVPAPAGPVHGRYVPPAGAALQSRRRVAYRFDPRHHGPGRSD